jgi:uncharacterized protein (DUF779 family)
VTLANPETLSDINNNNIYVKSESPPYPTGTVIQVNNYEEEKNASFVYVTLPLEEQIIGQAIRIIPSLKFNQLIDLKNFSEKNAIVQSTRASVLENGQKNDFIYYNKNWIKLGHTHKVANVAELNHLQFAQVGNIAQTVIDGQISPLIYSGQEWLPLNNEMRTVQSEAELNALPAKTGDLVAVVDIESNHNDQFFYANGKWIKKIHGGDAGEIVINAEQIELNQSSQISTASISGGGGQVTLNIDKMLYLTDSQVSTSVQESLGNGGNLNISEAQFVIINNGQIIAQAYQGRGGNIHLGAQQLLKSPCSQISASSEMGIDGNVEIDSPDIDIDAFMVILPDGYIEPELNHCTPEELENPSTFKVDLSRKTNLPFGK